MQYGVESGCLRLSKKLKQTRSVGFTLEERLAIPCILFFGGCFSTSNDVNQHRVVVPRPTTKISLKSRIRLIKL